MDLDFGKLIGRLPAVLASIRTRLEDGESRLEDVEKRAEAAEKRLATALDTIEAMAPAFKALQGVDLGRLAGELDAFASVAPAEIHPTIAAVLAAVPGADATHVSEAVAAHAEAIADGSTHEDAKVAAETAARDVGATPEQASVIAAAIPVPVGDGAVKADPPAVGDGSSLAGVASPGVGGKTILADGTVQG